MSFSAEQQAIEERFSAGWAAQVTDFPAAYGDAPFKAPSAGPWVRLSVVRGGAEQVELGRLSVAVLHRYAGIVFVQLFVPQSSSERPDRVAARVADLVAGVFARREILTSSGGLLRFRATELSPAPLLEKAGSGTLQYSIQTPFTRDEDA